MSRLPSPAWLSVSCLASAVLMLAPPAQAATRVTNVRTEYLVNPIGIDEKAPRFSWIVESPERGARQTAYQVLVASTPALLAKRQGDLWDSGKVTSGENAQVAYAGTPLASRTRYHVAVRVWDGKDKPADAPAATFETGVLDRALWKAKWIGLAPAGDDERLDLVGARWLWTPESKDDAKHKRIAFRATVQLPENAKPVRATLVFAGPGVGKPWDPKSQHTLFVNETQVQSYSAPASDPRHMDVLRALKPGDNQIAILSPFAARQGIIASLIIEYDGRRQVAVSDKTWRTRTFDDEKPTATWNTEPTDKAPWVAATEVGSFGDVVNPAEPAFKAIDKLIPPAYLRKTFSIKKPIAQARLYATAAGLYESQLNGKKVGNDFLTPGWTDYSKRVAYQTYDVTPLVKPGDNAWGAIVADGWYAGRTGAGQNLWGFDRAFLGELVITYKDGSSDVIVTDESWRGTTGPHRTADLLDGETYDARRELPGFFEATFNAATLRPAVIRTPPVGPLTAQIEPPVRNVKTLSAKKVTSPAPGVQIFDLGQNMVGWARVKFRARPGAVVTFRWTEMLNKDGTLFTENLRTANVIDRYIAKGGEATYEPRFTFHGFRYVEVSGHEGTLTPAAVTGIVLATDLPVTGTFETSNPQLNQLQSNIVWGQRGNFLSIPTDCPQRDERLGWTGDINMFARTATFNMDAASFLSKFVVDLEDGQRADGAFPDVAPTTPRMGFGNFGWGDVGVFLPWLLYEVYGDQRLLERHYESARRWVDFRSSRAKDFLNTDWSFGDWVSPPPQTPNKVLSPMYHAHAARLVARMARVLGKEADAKKYEDLVDKIKAAFAKAFVAADGKIESDTQAAYIIALRYDMLPADKRDAARTHLEAAIARANTHLNTGFLGTGNLLPSLTIVGRNDLAYQLLLTDTYPSWLYTVKNGATTMWERWDSYSPETGPSNKGNMNSYNHYAFGAVGEWMYAHVAGLDFDPAEPGWKRIVVRPIIGGGLTHARGEYQSIRGKVASSWKLAGKTLTLDVVVPVHATAKVFVPAATPDGVKEGGKPAASATGVKSAGTEPGTAVFDVGPGTYHFTSTIP